MDLFLTQPGSVVALSFPGVPVALYMDGWGGYSEFSSVITGFEVQTQEGVKYLHTLNDLIYVYVFGPRIAPMRVFGLAFAQQCEALQNQLGQQNHGLEYALAYYLLNRVSNTGAPVTLLLGRSTPFLGFLDGGSFNLVDPERILGQWSFNFAAIPQPSQLQLP